MNAARFICMFLASFLIFLYLIIPVSAGLWQGLSVWHAQASQELLSSVFGLESSVSDNVMTMDIDGRETDFAISQLCSGDVEIALLASLLIATFEVLFIWRLLGALIGSALIILMNPLRIAITLAITNGSGMEAGDAYHSIIFRLFLFVLLVLYYFAWYRAFAGRKSKTQQNIYKWLDARL